MMKYFFLFFMLSVCMLVAHTTNAQVENQAFFQIDKLSPHDSNTLQLNVDALGFTRNKEYFNDIADGYTIFGYQFSPMVEYQPLKNFSIAAGFFLRKDFGNDGLQILEPLFRFTYQRDSLQLIFGNLNGALAHRLIEPLYDFDKALVDPVENGMQFRYFSNSWWVDGWVSWEKMIYEGDPIQEEVVGGLSYEKSVFNSGAVNFYVPIQFLVYHRGGQIDDSPDPLVTFWNSAAGLRVEGKSKGSIKKWEGSFYYTYYKDFSFEKEQPFDDGEGYYINGAFTTSFDLQTMISYWRGNEFTSIMGGQLYPSVSSVYKNKGFVEKQRELIILRLTHELHLFDGVYITSRFEPYYDLNSETFEFSHGLYVNYRQPILLMKNVRR